MVHRSHELRTKNRLKRAFSHPAMWMLRRRTAGIAVVIRYLTRHRVWQRLRWIATVYRSAADEACPGHATTPSQQPSPSIHTCATACLFFVGFPRPPVGHRGSCHRDALALQFRNNCLSHAPPRHPGPMFAHRGTVVVKEDSVLQTRRTAFLRPFCALPTWTAVYAPDMHNFEVGKERPLA